MVNHKNVRRLMREHDLQPRIRRRRTTTTDSDHGQPISPNLAKDAKLDGPDQLWVADITYVPVTDGFVYVAIVLDAWSRRVVGYALSRSIDARLTLAALGAAVEGRTESEPDRLLPHVRRMPSLVAGQATRGGVVNGTKEAKGGARAYPRKGTSP